MERRCDTTYDTSTRVVGYQVDYLIGDKPGSVRMDSRPGDLIPLQDGQLVMAAKQ